MNLNVVGKSVTPTLYLFPFYLAMPCASEFAISVKAKKHQQNNQNKQTNKTNNNKKTTTTTTHQTQTHGVVFN